MADIKQHAPEPWGYFLCVLDQRWYIHRSPFQCTAGVDAIARMEGPDAEANGQRIVYCVSACKGIPTAGLGPGLHGAVLTELLESVRSYVKVAHWGEDAPYVRTARRRVQAVLAALEPKETP